MNPYRSEVKKYFAQMVAERGEMKAEHAQVKADHTQMKPNPVLLT